MSKKGKEITRRVRWWEPFPPFFVTICFIILTATLYLMDPYLPSVTTKDVDWYHAIFIGLCIFCLELIGYPALRSLEDDP